MTPSEAPRRRLPEPGEQVRVAFVNGGILGLRAFHQFLLDYLPRQSIIDGYQVLLTSDLTVADRIIRRVMCQRLWIDGSFGVTNVDLARFRQELHAGVLARRRLARLPPPEVLHFHRQATAYGSLDLMRRIPSIVSIDCTQQCVLQAATSRVERASYRANLRIDDAIFRRAAAIVSTSQWALDSLHNLHPRCDTPAFVVPSPVLLEQFDPAWIPEREARARGCATPHFMFMGSDFVRKGGYDLLDAWRDGDFGTRATLELVTDWPIEVELPPGVTVSTGIVAGSAEWRARWAAADVFVMPTRNEAFGLVYQEAAAAGIPAIGTAHNAIPEIIRHAETGLLVPPADRGALAVAMNALLASPGARRQLGTRAREIIEQVADPLAYLQRLTSIIVEARRRGVPRPN